MTAFDQFERRLPALLDDLAVTRMPDYADVLLARTAATRQRPGWTFLERWIPMSALTRRLAAAPQVPLRLAVVFAILVAAAIVGAIVAGSFTPHRPAPFGPAANGQIAYVDGTGRVLVGDPVTGQSKVVVNGGDNNRLAFSPDGSRLAFTRPAPGGALDLLVADADGSHLITITPSAIAAPAFIAWAPRGDQIVAVDVTGTLLSFDASRKAAPTNLSEKLGIGSIQIGSGHDDQTAHVFRPPTGDELLFVSHSGGTRLQAARLDGTGVRTLLVPASLGPGYVTLTGAQWSPDGSRVVVMAESLDTTSHLFVLDADGGNVLPLRGLSSDPRDDQAHPLWSPNGTQIGFQHWYRHATDAGVDVNPIEVVDLATGQIHEIGPTLLNGATWAWSPDGLSILELPADPPGDGHLLIVNVATGVVTRTSWIMSDLNWQRTAR